MQALQTLLAHSVDYAGLFPPARLDMATTVANFRSYRECPDAWMLGRLIVPVARLDEFEQHAAALLPVDGGPAHDDAWGITALTAAAEDPAFAHDLVAIDRFNDRHAERNAGSAIIDCIEVKASSAAAIDRAIDAMPDDLFPYFEISTAPDPRGMIAALASLDAGAKIRTGGLAPEAHPAPADVARFVIACARAEVPFKATAGLHHPLRHDAKDVGCKQHGFLNLFIGGCLAFAGRVDEAALAQLLEDESATSFHFAGDGVVWRDRRLTLGEIRAARDAFAHAFGSCSFTEPLADLRELGLLNAEGAAR
ncbi:MAG: hypothetical protein SGJ11_17450 [Phycisphaerae bacterium]|nr:hypothetical protein [Phycisphaerae bacterium]